MKERRIIRQENLITTRFEEYQVDTSWLARKLGKKPYKNVRVAYSMFGDFASVEYTDVRIEGQPNPQTDART